MPFEAEDVEVRISDVTDKVIYRQRRKVDAFGGLSADVPLGAGVALGDYSIAILHGEDTASGAFEVQEYRKPEFEVRVTPAERFVVQGGRITATVNARYYFGQPVANGKVAFVARKQPYYSPLRWSDDEDEGGGGYWYGDDQVVEGDSAAGCRTATRRSRCRPKRTRTSVTTACGSKRGSPTPATARCSATRSPTPPSAPS